MSPHTRRAARARAFAFIALMAALIAAPPGLAQTGDSPATLRAAVAAAWQRNGLPRLDEARHDEAAARRDAAASWTPEPPALSLTHRSDRLHRDEGRRELELELEVPLWLPGARGAALAVAEAENGAQQAALAKARLALAGEVRETLWSLRLARNAVDAGRRRLADAEALAMDVARRVEAGDLARVDANAAQAAVQLARAELVAAEAAALREQRLFGALTGLADAPGDSETPAAAAPEPEPDAHPALQAGQRRAELARQRLQQAATVTRDAPELTLGLTRERDLAGERYANTATLGIRVPFGTEARNRPQITAANAERIEAESAAAVARERLRAEADAARDELEQARRAEGFAAERARLAADTRQLLAKAFTLGQIDLPARLRAETEHYDAELALGRARLETGRAASRLNQAYGLLP